MTQKISQTGPRLLPSKIGLRPEHFYVLEHMPMDQAQAANIVTQIRTHYPDNPVVQRHLDVYDPNSEYQAMITLLAKAIKLENIKEKERLDAWFAMYYGDQDRANISPITVEDEQANVPSDRQDRNERFHEALRDFARTHADQLVLDALNRGL